MARKKAAPKAKKKPLTASELDTLIAEHEGKLQELKDSDPFMYFVPNTGELTDERRAFLERYLKPEDIPDRVDSQLDAMLSKADIRGVSGGNRSSKTVTGTVDGVIKATGELPRSLEQYRESHYKEIIERARGKYIHGRVTGVDNKQLHRVVIPAWKNWVPKEYLNKNSWEDSYSKEFDVLTLYRKGKACASVEFLTNTQDVDSSQGGDLDFAKFDEEPDQAKYKETLMRFGTAARLDIEIDWTPTKGLSWATDLFHGQVFDDEDGEDWGDSVVNSELFKLTTVCNSFVDLGTMRRIMDEYQKVSSYEEMKMRLLGEAISLSGLVYGAMFDRKVHVIQPFFEKLKPHEQREYLCLTGMDPHGVTNSAMLFALVDRENNIYVDRCYFRGADTAEIKADWHQIVKENNYRTGWAVADKSADSSIVAFSGRNIYKEISRGVNAIPALRTSIKFEGSIKAGVDDIKKRLKAASTKSGPSLYIVDRPENRELIKSFRTLERDTYTNEDVKGPKDRIREGKHHHHACLRYIHQFPVRWYGEVVAAPQAEMYDAAACY